jgi:hypothetical protein
VEGGKRDATKPKATGGERGHIGQRTYRQDIMK